MFKIACIGDSLTEGFGLRPEEALPSLLNRQENITAMNFGVSGDTTGGIVMRCREHLTGGNFAFALFMGGTNDAWFGTPVNEVLANFHLMMRYACQLGAFPVCGLPPHFLLPDNPDIVDMTTGLWPPLVGYGECDKLLEKYREGLRRLCAVNNLPCLDMQPLFCENGQLCPQLFQHDGIHFNAEGASRVAAAVVDALPQWEALRLASEGAAL